MDMQIKKRTAGFTFVELLVVVTIIAVLSGIAMVSFTGTNKNARDAKRKGDLEQIRAALEICRSETGSYPLSVGATVTCGGQDYLDPVPEDPREGQVGYGYQYTNVSATEYTLCALLMEGEDETSPYCVTNP